LDLMKLNAGLSLSLRATPVTHTPCFINKHGCCDSRRNRSFSTPIQLRPS
jgi:hypothetical protein